MTNESVSFKAYLKRDGQEVEVRRFGVDGGAATSFMYLRNKIQAMFPSIQNDQFTVFWQDNDKDYVAIGSDEELVVALTSGISQPFKLFINIASEHHSGQGSPGQSQVHPGVMCDSCDQGIEGFRYKCVTCPDFDLCATCEGAGRHPEHFMLRMPFPLEAASCHPRFFRKFFGRQHKFHKFARHHSQGPAGFSGGRCPFTRREEPAAPSAPEAAADMFDFSALMEFINSISGATAGQASEPAANAQTSSTSQATPGQQAGTQDARPPRPSGTDYLNGIGQAISAFLDPFGVDVTFDVRPPTSRTEETTAPQQTANTTAPTSASSPSQQNTPVFAQQNVPTSVPQNVPTAVPQNVPISVQQNVPSSSSSSSPRETSPAIERQPVIALDTTPLVARRNSDDWTVISRESPARSDVAMDVEENQAAKSSGAVPKEPQTAPPAPQASAPPASASPTDVERQHMQEAINNIRSMGFNYETRLLRELLRRENGDIASVLETILNSGKN